MFHSKWDLKEWETVSDEFLRWAKNHIDQWHPVITWWYTRTIPGQFEEYDHIMPIVGYVSDEHGKVTNLYYHDLYETFKVRLTKDETETEKALHSTKKESLTETDTWFPYEYQIDKDNIFAITILWPKDNPKQRVKLIIPIPMEPDYSEEDWVNSQPIEMNIWLELSNLDINHWCFLDRYEDADHIWQHELASESIHFHPTGSTMEVTIRHWLWWVRLKPINTDWKYFYRLDCHELYNTKNNTFVSPDNVQKKDTNLDDPSNLVSNEDLSWLNSNDFDKFLEELTKFEYWTWTVVPWDNHD